MTVKIELYKVCSTKAIKFDQKYATEPNEHILVYLRVNLVQNKRLEVFH